MKFKIYSLFIVSILYTYSFAGGNEYNTSFGTRTFSLNGLYFAGTPGLSSVQSNPAGLAYLNRGIEIFIADRIIRNNYESPVNGLYKSYNPDNIYYGGGLYWNLGSLTAAIAYNPVHNYLVDWPFVTLREINSLSSILSFSMRNKIEINSISPSAAFKFEDFSIGVTLNIYQVTNQLSFPIENPNWGDSGAIAAYQFNYDMDAWAFGGTLGLLYDVSDQIRIGTSVKSGFKADIKGDAKSNLFSANNGLPPVTDISSKLESPWKIGLGILYKLNERVSFNIDAAYNLWESTNKEMTFTFGNSIWQEGLKQIDPISGFSGSMIPLNYNNALDLGLGFEYSGELTYRGGYRFTQSPNSSLTYGFLFPSVDKHTLSFGIGYKNENLIIDAALAYEFGSNQSINRDENPYLYGEYNSSGYIPSLTLRYNFN